MERPNTNSDLGISIVCLETTLMFEDSKRSQLRLSTQKTTKENGNKTSNQSKV